MNTKTRFTLITLITLAALLAACGSPSPEVRTVEVPGDAQEVIVLATTEVNVAVEQETEVIDVQSPEENLAEVTPLATATAGGHGLAAIPDRPNRLIVKNAELELLVAETDVAIDLATQITADCAGYIISSRVWYDEWAGESYKYATITIGVPVDQFERAMRRMRSLALRVIDESASG